MLEQLAKIGAVLEDAQRARTFELADSSLDALWQQLFRTADKLLTEMVAFQSGGKPGTFAAFRGKGFVIRQRGAKKRL